LNSLPEDVVMKSSKADKLEIDEKQLLDEIQKNKARMPAVSYAAQPVQQASVDERPA